MIPTLPLIVAAEVGLGAWLAFGGLMLVLLVADLAVFHRQAQEATLRQSAIWTIVWCLIALAFNGFVWFCAGEQSAFSF